MELVTMAGLSLIAGAAFKAINSTQTAVLRKILRSTLTAMDKKEIQIKKIEREGQVYTVQFKLPVGFSSDEFQKLIQKLQEASYAQDTRYRHVIGTLVELKFGYEQFNDKMAYNLKLIDPERPLAVPLFSPFGTLHLDFGDETTCHLLVGGASRMGKSVFIRLLLTHLLLSTNGNITFYCADNKITDLYMFRDIPQIHDAETEAEAMVCLDKAIAEITERKAKLKAAGNVEDTKAYRIKYPNAEPMNPIFVVIDEYARFAENDAIQEKVTFIAETAGYLDVHLVIASQRPDVKDVLKPRIRGNILARMAFSTPDEANSRIILDLPDAAYLGRIRGRAVFSDGFPNKVQVPFITGDKSQEYVSKYKKNGWWSLREQQGSADSNIPQAVQSLIEGSAGYFGSTGEQQPSSNSQSDSKKTRKRRGSNPSAT